MHLMPAGPPEASTVLWGRSPVTIAVQAAPARSGPPGAASVGLAPAPGPGVWRVARRRAGAQSRGSTPHPSPTGRYRSPGTSVRRRRTAPGSARAVVGPAPVAAAVLGPARESAAAPDVSPAAAARTAGAVPAAGSRWVGGDHVAVAVQLPAARVSQGRAWMRPRWGRGWAGWGRGARQWAAADSVT